jgi:hypothetical protein
MTCAVFHENSIIAPHDSRDDDIGNSLDLTLKKGEAFRGITYEYELDV